MLEDKPIFFNFGPQPGAKRFLHFLVIIIVLILFIVFLQHISTLEQVVEKTAIEKKINEINSVLMVITMEHVVTNKQDDLFNYHQGNPFELVMARFPITNYLGEVKSISELKNKGGWYYNLKAAEVIYYSIQGEITKYQMVYSLAEQIPTETSVANKDELGLLVLEKRP